MATTTNGAGDRIIEIITSGPRGAPGQTGATGEGVPDGGLLGQFLRKQSDDNFDTYWDTSSVTIDLPGLTDVSDLTNPSIASQVLMSDGTDWSNQYLTMDGHADVTFSGLTNGQILAWDTASGQWVNVDASTETITAAQTSTYARVLLGSGSSADITQASTTEAGLMLPAEKEKVTKLPVTSATDASRVLAMSSDGLSMVVEPGVLIDTDEASLDVSGGLKGVRISELTEAQKLSLSPVAGVMIYNLDTNALELYNGTAWQGVGATTQVSTVVIPPTTAAGTPIDLGVQLGFNANEFNDSHLDIYFNGERLIKGTNVLWANLTEVTLTYSAAADDTIAVREG